MSESLELYGQHAVSRTQCIEQCVNKSLKLKGENAVSRTQCIEQCVSESLKLNDEHAASRTQCIEQCVSFKNGDFDIKNKARIRYSSIHSKAKKLDDT